MKLTLWIVEFVHQTRRANSYLQTGFLENLAFEVVGKGAAAFHAATWRAHKRVFATGIGINQQQFVIMFEDRTHSNPGA